MFIYGKYVLAAAIKMFHTPKSSVSGTMGAKFANAVASTVEVFSPASKATFVSSLTTQL